MKLFGKDVESSDEDALLKTYHQARVLDYVRSLNLSPERADAEIKKIEKFLTDLRNV